MNKTVLIIGAVVLIVALGGFLMNRSNKPARDTSSQTSSVSTTETSTINSGSSETVATTGGSNDTSAAARVKEFTVSGSSYTFEPATLRVNKGDTVKLTFKNSGGIHDFVIDELNVQIKQLNGGASETVTFVADKVGTFEYYCSVGNHRQMGMKGTLTVN